MPDMNSEFGNMFGTSWKTIKAFSSSKKTGGSFRDGQNIATKVTFCVKKRRYRIGKFLVVPYTLCPFEFGGILNVIHWKLNFSKGPKFFLVDNIQESWIKLSLWSWLTFFSDGFIWIWNLNECHAFRLGDLIPRSSSSLCVCLWLDAWYRATSWILRKYGSNHGAPYLLPTWRIIPFSKSLVPPHL